MEIFNLSSLEINKYLSSLGKQLRKIHIDGELIICGGAAMLLEYDSRETTKDIDGIFSPKTEINEIARKIAYENNLSDDWLNDKVKYSRSFIKTLRENSEYYKVYGNLTVYTVNLEQMIAMKLVAFRVGISHDLEDLEVLRANYNKSDNLTTKKAKEIIIKNYGDMSNMKQEAIEYIESLG
jgi:hypothetical protein